MKKILWACIVIASYAQLQAQNNISTPLGVYTPIYINTTYIHEGGNIEVGDGGLLSFGGKIIAADKGSPNSPNSTGKSEVVSFSGSGNYQNATVIPGQSGNIINGYVAVSGKSSEFVLPIGTSGIAYPVTVPAGAQLKAAYFPGKGEEQNKTIDGQQYKVSSLFIDLVQATPGDYIFSYPAGITAGEENYLVESGNSSQNGTTTNSSYNILASTPPFSSTAGTSLISIAKSISPTQLYFASSDAALLVDLVGFNGTVKDNQSHLTWKTVSETNNKGFAIERSTDGINYINIGFTPSQRVDGNSSAPLLYNFVDIAPVLGKTNYYRLATRDKNGKLNYSNSIVKLAIPRQNNGLKVFPNPAISSINVSGLTPGNTLSVYTLNGQQLKTLNVSNSTEKIDISTLASGVYILQEATRSGNLRSIKFIIK